MLAITRRAKYLLNILMVSMFILAITLNGNIRVFWDSLSQLKVQTSQPTNINKNILLFSYMRSGSTVTGNLLRDSPGVFFMFEPLSPLAPYSYFTNTTICEMRNITCRSKNVSARIETALLALVNLYSCNLRKVPESVIDKMVQEGKSGTAWEEYGECFNKTQPENSIDVYRKTRCLHRLEQACKTANYRVAKVLRLGFTTIEPLLTRISSLKVIYLTRDPRAIINSRIKTSWFPVFKEKPRTVSTNIRSLCLKMETDIISWKTTKLLYKARILHTTLANLACKLTAIPEMFMFINKEVTRAEKRKIIKYIYMNWEHNITEKWRTELDPFTRRNVGKHCFYVIQHVK